MSNKIKGKVLAIQLGMEETQLVLLDNGETIMHTVSLATPVGAVDDGVIQNPDAIRGMLKQALKDPYFGRVRKAVFTLCTSQVIAETVVTPVMADAKLGKVIRANADMYFPVDIQDYQLVWQVIGPSATEDGTKGQRVQLWAVPHGMLRPYYQVANACGLSVQAIDYCGHGMATAADASFAAPAKAAKAPKEKP